MARQTFYFNQSRKNERFIRYLQQNSVHLSKNMLKNDENTRFITLREFGNKAIFEGEKIGIALDISFNLEIDQEAIPLIYKLLQGEPFILSHTPPLALQVAWKLHQCLVRPRFKDMFDLIYLLNHEDFRASSQNIFYTLQTLANECKRDNIDIQKLAFLINGDITPLYTHREFGKRISFTKEWQEWRFESGWGNSLADITTSHNVSEDVCEFAGSLKNAFQQAGFSIETLKKIRS